MKRFVYCLDNAQMAHDNLYPTNISMIERSISSYDKDIRQIRFYKKEVMRRESESLSTTLFGNSVMDSVYECYAHLCEHYEVGDEIFIFGFGKGAFQARSLAGMISYCGLVTAEDNVALEEAKVYYQHRITQTRKEIEEFNYWRMQNSIMMCANEEDYLYRKEHSQNIVPSILKIKYIGVLDTVNAMGLFNFYPWQDTILSSQVESARHIMALDERRKKFTLIPWSNISELNAKACENGREDNLYQQLWFPGTHSLMGGGGMHRGLSDEAFRWIVEGAKQAGLKMIYDEDGELFTLNTNPLDWIYPPMDIDKRMILKAKLWLKCKLTMKATRSERAGPMDISEVHDFVKIRFLAKKIYLPEKKLYRPASLEKLKHGLLLENLVYNYAAYQKVFLYCYKTKRRLAQNHLKHQEASLCLMA